MYNKYKSYTELNQVLIMFFCSVLTGWTWMMYGIMQFFIYFSAPLSFLSSPPQPSMISDFEGFLSQILFITFFVLSLFFRKSQYFPFQLWVLNKGTTGTIFITSLVWRGPWLGIEPGTARTRSQHYTTRLSRRRWYNAITSSVSK